MTIDFGELAGNIAITDTRVTVPPKDSAAVTVSLKSVVPTNMKFSQRLLNLLMGSILFLILSPLFIALIVGIKMDTPGPAIFYQRRLGHYGREFKCYKFRTMFQDNQAILERHLHDNPTVREDWDKFAKLRGNDPRVTRSGKWLRCWSLDELPQLRGAY